jgi:hypothetical protein
MKPNLKISKNIHFHPPPTPKTQESQSKKMMKQKKITLRMNLET